MCARPGRGRAGPWRCTWQVLETNGQSEIHPPHPRQPLLSPCAQQPPGAGDEKGLLGVSVPRQRCLVELDRRLSSELWLWGWSWQPGTAHTPPVPSARPSGLLRACDTAILWSYNPPELAASKERSANIPCRDFIIPLGPSGPGGP